MELRPLTFIIICVLSFVNFANADPCAQDFGGCDKTFGLCWGTGEDTHFCTCKAGFKPVEGADKHKCIDINECLEDDVCDDSALCENTYGSYICTCRCGYVKDYTGRHCLDASMITDMCMVPRRCYHEFLWLSTWFDKVPFDTKYGKRRYLADPLSGTRMVQKPVQNEGICECEEGFSRNKCGYCVDMDECTTSDGLCPDEAFCVNTEGSFYCECKPGYALGPCRKTCYRAGESIPLICDAPKLQILSSAGISSSASSFQRPNVLHNWRKCADGVMAGELTQESYDVDQDKINDLTLTWVCESTLPDSSNRPTSRSVLKFYTEEEATWGSWTCWTACKATCWGGLQIRVRKCIHGLPGTPGCEGEGSQKRECYKGKKCSFRIRKDATKLTEAETDDLLQAMEKFKNDKTVKGFHNTAAAHGWPFQCNGRSCCHHGAKLKFLSWHRLLTLSFEEGLSRYLKNKTLGIPYWNWLAADKTPPALVWSKTIKMKENPFANATVLIDRDGPMRTIQRDEKIFERPLTFANETWAEVTKTLMQPHVMHEFSESLENVHGGAHVSPCGQGRQTTTCQISLAVLTFSSFDPLFMVHHSQTDRLWAVAQMKMEKASSSAWTSQTALEALEERGDFGRRNMPFANKTINGQLLLQAVNTMRDSYYYKELMGVEYDSLENDGYPPPFPEGVGGKSLKTMEILFVGHHFRSVERNVYINYYTVFEDEPCSNLTEEDRVASTILMGTDVAYRNSVPNLALMEKVGFTRLDLDLNIKACYTYSPTCKEKCQEVQARALKTMPDPSLVLFVRNQPVEIHKFNWSPGRRTPNWPIQLTASTQWIFFYGSRAANVVQVASAREWTSCDARRGRPFECSIENGSACVLPVGIYYLIDSKPKHCRNGLRMIVLARK